jgi:hypothetical protein
MAANYSPPYAPIRPDLAKPRNLIAAAELGEHACAILPQHPNGVPAVLTFLLRAAAARIEELEKGGESR